MAQKLLAIWWLRGSPCVKGAGSSLPSSLAKTGQCHIIGIMVGEELTEPEIAPPGWWWVTFCRTMCEHAVLLAVLCLFWGQIEDFGTASSIRFCHPGLNSLQCQSSCFFLGFCLKRLWKPLCITAWFVGSNLHCSSTWLFDGLCRHIWILNFKYKHSEIAVALCSVMDLCLINVEASAT